MPRREALRWNAPDRPRVSPGDKAKLIQAALLLRIYAQKNNRKQKLEFLKQIERQDPKMLGWMECLFKGQVDDPLGNLSVK
jgi:hypothetical protein